MRKPMPRPAAGALMLIAMGLILALIIAFYARAFSNPLKVELVTGRAGLIMASGNKVKYEGVEIGRVGSVTRTATGAILELELDRRQSRLVPANALANIQSSTIFGAKYVALMPPQAGDSPISDGTVINATAVTTEVDTLFASLDRLLTSIDVAQLNTTLTSFGTALDGRGDEIATLAHRTDAYLTALQPHLPQLRSDLAQAAQVAQLGVNITPALMSLLDNASTTMATVGSSQAELDRLLVDLAVFGKSGATFVGEVGPGLQKLLATLVPTADLAYTYAPEIPCFFKGLDVARQLTARSIGGASPGLRVFLSLGPGQNAYSNPSQLPVPYRGTGPVCAGLPNLSHPPAAMGGN